MAEQPKTNHQQRLVNAANRPSRENVDRNARKSERWRDRVYTID